MPRPKRGGSTHTDHDGVIGVTVATVCLGSFPRPLDGFPGQLEGDGMAQDAWDPAHGVASLTVCVDWQAKTVHGADATKHR